MKERLKTQIIAKRKSINKIKYIHSQYMAKSGKCDHLDKVNQMELLEFDIEMRQLDSHISGDIRYTTSEIEQMSDVQSSMQAERIESPKCICEKLKSEQKIKELSIEEETIENALQKEKEYLYSLEYSVYKEETQEL